jgi:hypothetical protein
MPEPSGWGASAVDDDVGLAPGRGLPFATADSGMMWDKQRVMTEIKRLADPCWQDFLT